MRIHYPTYMTVFMILMFPLLWYMNGEITINNIIDIVCIWIVGVGAYIIGARDQYG